MLFFSKFCKFEKYFGGVVYMNGTGQDKKAGVDDKTEKKTTFISL